MSRVPEGDNQGTSGYHFKECGDEDDDALSLAQRNAAKNGC